ncbi:hypothetical protein [Arenimonas sp.]|uniref:hypothetical protein n=1 Tax=Arenimonas sp. TaxID=1872635 RepID=UPI0039E5B3D9
MSDSLRPATWLLGTACLWAAAVFGLALAGLGSRVAPTTLPKEGVPTLPKLVLQSAPSRLGPMGDYFDVGARPLLAPDRRPSPVAAAEGTSDFDAVLTSVLITPQLRLAILTDKQNGNSRRVRLGETVTGTNWQLVQLDPRRAVLEGPSGQRTLDLRVFDGNGGSAPTEVAPVNEAEASTPAQDAKAAPVAAQPPPPPKPQAAPSPPSAQTQEDQVAEIRRRIEARRAQMRADAAREAQQSKKD